MYLIREHIAFIVVFNTTSWYNASIKTRKTFRIIEDISEASRQAQPLGSPFVSYKPAFVIDNKDIALWHAKNDNPPMRVRHILEYVENGEMVGKDVLEYDASTDKWHRIEAVSIELV